MFYLIKKDGATIGAIEASESMGALDWFSRNVRAYSMAHACEREGYSVDAMPDGPDCHDVAGTLQAIALRVGVAYSATFVPFSQSRNAKPGKDGKVWRSLNWRVSLAKGGAHPFIVTDYSQGEAYCPSYEQGARQTIDYVAKIDHETETGRAVRQQFAGGSIISGRHIPPPAFGDVLSALARDSDVLDCSNFEEWVNTYGYETDSREAEKIYRACLESALAMRSGFGDSVMQELRTVAAYN